MALPTVLGMDWVESFLKKEYFLLSKTLPIMEYMVSTNIYISLHQMLILSFTVTALIIDDNWQSLVSSHIPSSPPLSIT